MPTVRQALRSVRSFFGRLFRSKQDPDLQAVSEWLGEMPLFRHLSGSVRRDLAEALHRRRYRRDAFLYYEHDPGLGLFIVEEGRVRLFTELPDGSRHDLREVGAGAFFGDLSVLGVGELRRTETAQALTDAVVLGLFSPDLKTMLKRTPRSAAAVLVALARHMAVRQVGMVYHLSEDDPVAARLLFHQPLPADLADADLPLLS